MLLGGARGVVFSKRIPLAAGGKKMNFRERAREGDSQKRAMNLIKVPD
jgi:hypothetical protein